MVFMGEQPHLLLAFVETCRPAAVSQNTLPVQSHGVQRTEEILLKARSSKRVITVSH